MSFRDADAYVAGINDLVNGNEKYGVMSAAEKMERGRVAVGELARYRAALEAGDQAVIDQITAKFDPSKPEGEEFLREYFAYFGYGYLDTPQQIVPNVPLLFYSFRVMVGAGCFFILLLGVIWWLNRKDKLADKRWLLRVAVWSIPLAYPRFAGRLGAGRGRTPAVGHPGSDARGHRGLEDRPRVGIGHLLHLPRALHGVADRRAEHHVPPDQNRARKRKQ